MYAVSRICTHATVGEYSYTYMYSRKTQLLVHIIQMLLDGINAERCVVYARSFYVLLSLRVLRSQTEQVAVCTY
jgi:hypothetical protein